MKHFYRSRIPPAHVVELADRFFAALEMDRTLNAPRARAYVGPLGTLKLAATKEGGHYTYVAVETDQMGESRLDRNAKRFFVELKRAEDPAYQLAAAY
jgi:hypothetical protein